MTHSRTVYRMSGIMGLNLSESTVTRGFLSNLLSSTTLTNEVVLFATFSTFFYSRLAFLAFVRLSDTIALSGVSLTGTTGDLVDPLHTCFERVLREVNKSYRF